MRDRSNPDPSLRDRPLVGIDILADLRPEPDGSWDGGTIYDPTSGRTYRCTMAMGRDDRLLVRGYVGFHVLGRTTTWVRVGSENLRCESASSGTES